jgi:MFS family permease
MNKHNKALFYGWWIAAASGLGIGCGMAVLIPATLGLLVAPLHESLGWTSREIFLAPIFNTTGLILVTPFIGGLVTRFGARRVIGLSFGAEALLIASFSYLGADIHWFYARFAALALFAAGTTSITFAAVISRWFDRRRGLALGIALAGFGLGGAIWSLLLHWLIDNVGWRNMFLWQGGIIAFLVLPILLLSIRNEPEAMGLHVDGLGEADSSIDAKRALEGMTLKQAAGTGQYWLMLATFLLIGTVVPSIMFHIVPLLKARGVSPQLAAGAQASLWAVLVLGRVSTGWLMDRYFAPRVALAFLALPIVGVSLLAAGSTGATGFCAVILVGLAAGAEADIIAYLVGRYFGLKHYAVIYATYFSIYALGSGIGPATTAWAVERTGGYTQVLWGLAVVLIAAAVLLLGYKPYPVRSSPATFAP